MSFEGLSRLVNRIFAWADRLQRKHGVLGFPYAVVKKYGDDDGGRQAALITYYGFLSIFPLLLLAVAVLSRVLTANDELRERLINEIVPPKLVGPEEADVTLVGWGSTEGVIREAVEKLAAEEGIVANQLAIKWIVPLHASEIGAILRRSKNVIMVENNQSGQFARYLRSETGFAAHGHIRKYDGEPFMPHHIVEAVKEQLAGKTRLSVPVHEVNA